MVMHNIDEAMTKLIVPRNIIPETVSFLLEAGTKGYEGRAYWIGKASSAGTYLTRVAIPEQIARRTIYGVSVTVQRSANIKISRSLKTGEYIVAKVHSHPERAYNSDVDKENPFLRHEGSISIIVPNFGFPGMDRLRNCVVCLFCNGRWIELTQTQVQKYFLFE